MSLLEGGSGCRVTEGTDHCVTEQGRGETGRAEPAGLCCPRAAAEGARELRVSSQRPQARRAADLVRAGLGSLGSVLSSAFRFIELLTWVASPPLDLLVLGGKLCFSFSLLLPRLLSVQRPAPR